MISVLSLDKQIFFTHNTVHLTTIGLFKLFRYFVENFDFVDTHKVECTYFCAQKEKQSQSANVLKAAVQVKPIRTSPVDATRSNNTKLLSRAWKTFVAWKLYHIACIVVVVWYIAALVYCLFMNKARAMCGIAPSRLRYILLRFTVRAFRFQLG